MEKCRKIIKAAWDDCRDSIAPNGIATILKQCVMDLSRWNKAVFAQVSWQIQKKRKTLSTLVLRDRGGSLGNEINTLRQEINDLLDSEEIMWQQRSKVQWMRLGDRNTKYFHLKALERKKENAINRIMDENGN